MPWFPMNRLLAGRAVAVLLVALVAACGTRSDGVKAENPFRPGKSERELRLEASELYRRARGKLESADYAGALADFGSLQARFPFSDYATQAQLESLYAQYRNHEHEQALAATDRFLREHPRHAAADYVLYLRGTINFTRGQGMLDGVVDNTRHDVTNARRAFDDFSALVQRYPDSRYAADARLRMIHLRNQIAEHELHVVRFYIKRGAYVAAARRAEQIIAQYPGAPGSYEALRLLAESYAQLGLREQARDAKRILEINEPALAQRTDIRPPRPWWQRLWPFGDDEEDDEDLLLPPAS
jgi:outer membrane protein assembly factor BamD